MQAFLDRLTPILQTISRVSLWIAGAALVLMTTAVSWQVFGRYILNDSPSWTEPFALQCMLWASMLAAGVGVRERFHLSLDIIRGVVPDHVRGVMDGIAAVFVSIFGLAMTFYGIELSAGTWHATKPVIGIPEAMDYIPIVIGGAMVFAFSLEQILRLLFAGDVAVNPHLAHASQAASAD